MSVAVSSIVPGAKLVLAYAQALLKDVKPEQFARLARGVHSNHPAWVFGHLAIYPDRCIELLGRKDLMRPDERFNTLFANKSPCIDDADGKVYPPMSEITERFFSRSDALLIALGETKDEVLAKVITGDGMADRLPTVGSRICFLTGAHPMSHLGQVSAWRRFMGLSSAF